MPLVCLILNARGSVGADWKEHVRTSGCKLIEVGTVSEGLRLLELSQADSPGLLKAPRPGIATESSTSSPSMALFQDGKPVYMLHRSEIERREPAAISAILTDVFDQFCAARKMALAPSRAPP